MLLFLLYFGSNKGRLGEQKILLFYLFKKTIKNLTLQKPLTGSVFVQYYIDLSIYIYSVVILGLLCFFNEYFSLFVPITVCYQGRVRCRFPPEQYSYLRRRPAPIQHRALLLQCCSSHRRSRLIQSTSGSGNACPPHTPPPTTHTHTHRFRCEHRAVINTS